MLALFLFVTACMFQGFQLHAQTFPPATSCTSKDLELISATLPAPAANPCQCSGTRNLMLGIRNKTGSTRTSFALWGTLKRFNAAGEQVDDNGIKTTAGTPIFACANQVKANSDNQLQATSGLTSITVRCGESLVIENLYLAWTTANSNETCDFLRTNTATLNPKCGTLPSIKIGLGVTADFSVNNATCAANGSLQVFPSGGLGPYKVTVAGTTRTGIVAGSSTTFSLPSGTYNIEVTDSRGCINNNFNRTIGNAAAPDVSGIGGAFTKTCTAFLNGALIGETPATGFTYSWAPTTGLSTANVGNPTANPTTTTTYTVTKTNTATGCTSTKQVLVTVDRAIPGISDIGYGFTKTCSDFPNGTYIGESPVIGFTYAWVSNTGLSDANIGNPLANPDATTTYTVTKTSTTNGCSNTKQVVVTVDQAKPSISSIGGAFTKTCIANTNGGTIGESGQTGFTYAWTSVPSGFTASSADPNVNPQRTTNYTVRKTNPSNGCYAEATVTVTVNNTLPDVSSIGGEFTKTCVLKTSGADIGETPVTGFTYSWSPAAGLSAYTIGNPNANPTTTTTYTVTKTETATGCFNAKTVLVTVDQVQPSVNSIGGAFTRTCISNTNGATIGETPVDDYSYTWLPATGLSASNIGNPTANPTVSTTYTVTKTNLTNGCTNTRQVAVTVHTTTPDISGIGGAFTKTCTTNASGAAIGETAQAGFSYAWTSSPVGFTATSAYPTVNPTATTVYTVTKTNNTNGCYADAPVTVTVNTTIPDVGSIGGAFTKTCVLNTSGATIGETPASGFSYAWAPATGLSDAAISNPTANPAASTTYTVTKTNLANGCTDTRQVVVAVNTEAPNFSVCISQPSLCANSGSVSFAASGGSGFEYSIDNGTNFQSSNSFTGLGSGSVSGYKVKNGFGCVTTVSCSDVVMACAPPVSLNNQQQRTISQKVVLEGKPVTQVRAAPNPFSDKVRFQLESASSGYGILELYNLNGQKVRTVFQGYVQSGKAQMVDFLVPGYLKTSLVYVFRVGDQQVTGKLIGLK